MDQKELGRKKHSGILGRVKKKKKKTKAQRKIIKNVSSGPYKRRNGKNEVRKVNRVLIGFYKHLGFIIDGVECH